MQIMAYLVSSQYFGEIVVKCGFDTALRSVQCMAAG